MGPLLESYHLLSYESLDSTNEEAKRLAHGGGGHGAVLWAKKQTHGRGREKREWVSLDGNLFVSMLLSPARAVADYSQLSFVAALAVHDAIVPLLPDANALQLKWPNDLLLNGKKIGGILLEAFHTPAKDDRLPADWVVVGVGVNIEACPGSVAHGAMNIPATHLKAAGVEIVSAKIVLSRFIHHFILRYDAWETQGFSALQADWLERAHPIGAPLRATIGNESLNGSFAGLGAHGECLMAQADGSTRTISAGDVYLAAE